jgi:hypothetical protein
MAGFGHVAADVQRSATSQAAADDLLLNSLLVFDGLLLCGVPLDEPELL